MSLSQYFEQHEEQAFVAKALATAVGIIFLKRYFADFISFLFLIFPVVFFIGIRMHAAALGVDANELLREHITFIPVMRSERERLAEVKPWVTYGIILINVLIFYLFETGRHEQFITDNLVFLPNKPDAFNVVYSAITAMFLHANNGHLWGNMTFLWVVGTAVERRVGRKSFLALYLLTGVIGGLVYVLVEFLFMGKAGHALGASGAIAGIMGIFAVRCYFKSMIFPVPILGIFSLILPLNVKVRLNSIVIMALFFLADLSGGIGQITGESHSMVGHWAHLGGMISGIILAGYLKLNDAAVEERHLEIGLKASEAMVGFAGGAHSMQVVLEKNPEHIEALVGLARLKTKFVCDDEGRELYEKAIPLMVASNSADPIKVFGEYVGKYRSVPQDPVMLARLSEILRKAGENDLCIHCLKHLVDMPGASLLNREKALFQLGTLLEFIGCDEAASGYFARFVAEFPDSVLAQKAQQKAGNTVYRKAPAAPSRVAEPAAAPRCPVCGAAMTTRTATGGANRGKLFHVCSSYPACRTSLPVPTPGPVAETDATVRQQSGRRYRLVCDGTISFAADPEETKDNIARLFRCDRQRVERLLNGTRTVLKKGLDQASAMRLKEQFDATGAISSIEVEEAPAAGFAPVPAPTAVEEAPRQERPAFECPKCGFLQEKGETCVKCGVYFAKLTSMIERELLFGS